MTVLRTRQHLLARLTGFPGNRPKGPTLRLLLHDSRSRGRNSNASTGPEMITGRLASRRPTLKIKPYQGIFHLHPRDTVERVELDALGELETFFGNVELSLPKARELTSLVVRLVAHYSLALPGQSTETGILGSWETRISIPKRLGKGDHSFAWALKMPRSSPPYERCAFGNVNYRLVAVADGPAGVIESTKHFEVIAVPVRDGETSCLNERIEGSHEGTGPYMMSLQSEHLTVGGVLHFSLSLPSVPSEFHLHSVTAIVAQSYTLHSHATPGLTKTPRPHIRPIFHLDYRTPLWSDNEITCVGTDNRRRVGTVLKTSVASSMSTLPQDREFMASLPAGHSLHVSHVARLPDDYILRASTLAGTNTPIRISHKIILDVKFSTAGTAPRLLRTERPLTLLSCGCLPDSLVLPSYNNIVDPHAAARLEVKKRLMETATGTSPDDYYLCVCLYGFDTLAQPLLALHKAHAAGEPRREDIFAASKLI